MPRDPRQPLEDIRAAAGRVRSFAAGKSIENYRTDAMLKAAIEREFITIGEALRRLEGIDASLVARITDHRKIIAFRNVLTHAYDIVDAEVVWSIVEGGVETLATEAEALLRELGEDA